MKLYRVFWEIREYGKKVEGTVGVYKKLEYAERALETFLRDCDCNITLYIEEIT